MSYVNESISVLMEPDCLIMQLIPPTPTWRRPIKVLELISSPITATRPVKCSIVVLAVIHTDGGIHVEFWTNSVLPRGDKIGYCDFII